MAMRERDWLYLVTRGGCCLCEGDHFGDEDCGDFEEKVILKRR